MQREMKLEGMFCAIQESLKLLGLGKYSLRNYYYEGMCPIAKAYRNAGKDIYDPTFTAQIVLDVRERYLQGVVGHHIDMHVHKVAALLEEYCDTGKIEWRRIPRPVTVRLTPYYADIVTAFKAAEENAHIRGPKAIEEFCGIIRRFFEHLEKSGHEMLHTVTLKTVSKYLVVIAPRHKGSMDSVLRSLRYLCNFIMKNEIICIDFRPALTARPSQRRKVMPVFTAQEVTAISTSVDTASPMAKRDTAIFAIAQSVGLRAIDIANMKLKNIDWNLNEIKIVQHKTNVQLTLPLEPHVGNAIADYILNERPKTNSEYVFVRARTPHGPIGSDGIGDRLRVHMKKAGIDYTPGDMKGFHSFRRYVATQMLDEGVPADTVKEVLGHTQINSLKPYARISHKQLRSCALGLDGIEVGQAVLL